MQAQKTTIPVATNRNTLKHRDEATIAWLNKLVLRGFDFRIVKSSVAEVRVDFGYKLHSRDNGGLVQSMTEAQFELNRFGEVVGAGVDNGHARIVVLINRENVGL